MGMKCGRWYFGVEKKRGKKEGKYNEKKKKIFHCVKMIAVLGCVHALHRGP